MCLKDCPDCMKASKPFKVINYLTALDKSNKSEESTEEDLNDSGIKIDELINVYHKRVNKLRITDSKVLTWMEGHKTELKELEKDAFSKAQEELFKQVKREFLSRRNRRKNVVLWGVEESDRETEKALIDSIIKTCEIPLEIGKIASYRIGTKVEGKRRPLKVMLRSMELATKVLQCKKVIFTKFKKIRALPDQTDLQRKYLKKLRARIEELNRDAPERKYAIKYVRGVPQIVEYGKKLSYMQTGSN